MTKLFKSFSFIYLVLYLKIIFETVNSNNSNPLPLNKFLKKNVKRPQMLAKIKIR